MRYRALKPEAEILLVTRSTEQMKLGMFHDVKQKAWPFWLERLWYCVVEITRKKLKFYYFLLVIYFQEKRHALDGSFGDKTICKEITATFGSPRECVCVGSVA